MKKNQYFLVVRNHQNSWLQILPVNNSWGSSLEEIDLETIRYKDSKDLLKHYNLFLEDVDLFIISQENSILHIQEVLFQEDKEVSYLANASLKGTLEKERNITHPLLNNFCRKMKENQIFYDKVIYEETALYPKFVRYFLEKRMQDSLHHLLEYQNQNPERLKNKDKLLMMTAKHYHPSQPSLFNFIDEEEFEKVLEKEEPVGAEHGYQKCKRNRGIR